MRKYPIPCVLGAAALGFWIGRHRGKAIAIAVAGYATNLLVKEMNRAFDTSEF